MTDSTPVRDQLRSQTRDLHSQLEALPYHKTLQEGKLPIECYVSLLRAMAVVYGVLEKTLPLDNPVIREIWREDMQRFPLLEKDLAFFQPRRLLDIAPAQEKALQMTDLIRSRVIEKPMSLAGYLYVFEGSTMGAPLIRKALVDHFQFPGNEGTHYFAPYGSNAVTHWKEFRERLQQVVPEEKHDALIEAAREAFTGLIAVYEALYPFDRENLRATSTSLNPEAGRHNVPQDEAEFNAALHAGDLAWEELPYYQLRYGDRGKRFADSDSAWLATLVDHEQSTLNKQVDWLARLLAVRGMPRWVMERHLARVQSELTNTRPDRTEEYAKLGTAVAHLRRQRLAQIDQTTSEALIEAFESVAPNDWQRKLPYSGHLLVSALADEKAGIERALPSLLEWLADPDRFPPEWVDAVLEVISRARE